MCLEPIGQQYLYLLVTVAFQTIEQLLSEGLYVLGTFVEFSSVLLVHVRYCVAITHVLMVLLDFDSDAPLGDYRAGSLLAQSGSEGLSWLHGS